jgi:hypothetical protein
MFFHFPHYVSAPKNMSASAVIHKNLKLIREYTPNGSAPYTYALYDLSNDIGEASNLASAQPDTVTELDAMITQHLIDTDTPTPPRNPAFDPNAFNPITGEGTPPATTSTPANANGGTPTGDPDADAIEGWVPTPNSRLSLKTGALVIASNTKDPGVMTREFPETSGTTVARLRMKTRSGGDAQFFWASTEKPGYAGHGVDFVTRPNGEWNEYQINLPAVGRLTSIRLDPARAPGETEVDWIELQSPDGTVLKRWDFEVEADDEPS